MNARFLLPATIAAVAHLAVIFGYHCPPRHPVGAHRPADPPAKPFETFEEKEVSLVPVDPESVPHGVTDIAPPPTDEPPPNPLGDFQLPPSPPSPGSVNAHLAIIPGPIGDLQGTGPAGIRGPSILGVTALDHEPRTRSQVAPIYPSAAKADARRGEVTVEFVVDEDGRVRNPRVVRSSDTIFEEPTLRAVERWRFEPGRSNGRIVRFRMAVPVVFSLST